MTNVRVAGVGMIPFTKPGQSEDWDVMAEKAIRPATQPVVDLDGGLNDGEDVKISVTLEVLPDVPDAEIEGIALERLTVAATDAEVDAAVKRLVKGNSRGFFQLVG